MAHDSRSGKPSVTLLIFYSGLILSIISIVVLHMDPSKYLSASLVTLLFLGMGFVFYRMRNLDKVKIDLDDKSIELGGEDGPGNSSGDDSEGADKSS